MATNELDRLVKVTDALGGVATTVWDPAGNNLIATVNPLGKRTSYGYDLADRLE